MDYRAHWEQVYTKKADAELSWYQDHPSVSLELFDRISPKPRRVIDAGGGQSLLAEQMLDQGAEHAVVIDISETAIQRSRERISKHPERIEWIVGDVLRTQDLGTFDLWHDRAVFHFLSTDEDKARYIQAVTSALTPGTHAIIGGFAPTGPEKCSGIPVQRHDAKALAATFGSGFSLLHAANEQHMTPWGAAQDFVYVLLERTGSAAPPA